MTDRRSADPAAVPYLAALLEHTRRRTGRYNVPTHKGGAHGGELLREAFGEQALAMDIPPLVAGIDAFCEPTPLELSQRLAAAAWGAERTWFLNNGASQANHAICAAFAQLGEEVVVQRNAHSSVTDGLIISGLRPRFVAPRIDLALGVAHCLEPKDLDRALGSGPRPAGVIVVSPTYYGAAADVAGLVEAAHSHGVPVAVDEAWGSHFAFSAALPVDAIAAGADIVVSSTHKMLGSLTQSAMIHIGPEAMVDAHTVDRGVTLFESTSPSALLAGSLDAARYRATAEGPELLERTCATARRLRQEIDAIPGLRTIGDELVGEYGVAGFDPLRIAIDVRATGLSGQEINRRLNRRDVYVELIDERVLVAVISMGETIDDTRRLLEGLRAAVEEQRNLDEGMAPVPVAPPWGPLAKTPRQAFFADQQPIELECAAGRVAAESLAVYPPGIPNVLPGERITGAAIGFLQAAKAAGRTVRGASDRSLGTVRVTVPEEGRAVGRASLNG